MADRLTGTAQARWAHHLTGAVLPWWEGAQRPGGGVFTCFDNQGRLLSRELYTWSQGRWAWLAAELASEARAGRLDVDAELWSARSRDTAALIADHALLGDGTTAFRLDEHGGRLLSRVSGASPDDPGQYATSVFADLFAALGLAGAVRISPDDPRSDGWFEQAVQLLATATASITEHRAVSEPYPVPDGYADLAGPMTLVHTSAELLRARRDERVLACRDAALLTLLGDDAAFLDGRDESSARWWEFRPLDQPGPATLLSRHRTPGHLLELTWMLIHAIDQGAERGDLPGWLDQPVVVPRLARLGNRALELGWDEQYGGLLRYTDTDGGAPREPSDAEPLAGTSPYQQLVERTWDSKLWWVHAEAMYAAELLARRSGSPALRQWATRVQRWTMDTFPAPNDAEWIQIRDRTGAPLDEVVALPVKDPFHIARAVLLLNRLQHPTTTPQEQDAS